MVLSPCLQRGIRPPNETVEYSVNTKHRFIFCSCMPSLSNQISNAVVSVANTFGKSNFGFETTPASVMALCYNILKSNWFVISLFCAQHGQSIKMSLTIKK